MCGGLGAYPDHRPAWIGELPRDQRCRARAGAVVRDRKGFLAL